MRRGMLCVAAWMCAGCGTIFYGNHQTVPIRTTPAEARVKIPDMVEAASPTRVTLERGESYLIEIYKEGYQPRWIVLDKHLAKGPLFADIFLTGGVGIVIDYLTGSLWGMRPSTVDVTLEQVGATGISTDVPLWLTETSIHCPDPTVRIAAYAIGGSRIPR